MYVEDEKREAEMNIKRETALKLADRGILIDEIANLVDVNVDVVKEWLECSATIAN
jgi:predicted phosphatase